jgi:ssDNA-binding Zn-finger/Zn-ribbon topoisomerase 1
VREIEELGSCPKCDCSIIMYKTRSYKRFAKCDVCEISYPLPKRGSISNSALVCPKTKFPILIVEKRNSKAYFWSDRPCFTCTEMRNCGPVKTLEEEFAALEVHGY